MSVQDFQIIAKLGQGAYSSVYQVRRLSDNIEYALKKVKLGNLSDQEKQNALNEVRILASIRHQNIVGYKEAFLDEPSNSLCIVMEYANNGDVFQRIVELQKQNQLMSQQEIWSIFIQVVKGLQALHDLQIYHRDLKSANVFLTKEGIVKLGDMNVSKVAQKGLLYTQTGTPYYASPQVWKDQPYDSQSDIWSLGCVLYEMTTLQPPFRAEDMEGLYQQVIRGYYPRIPQQYSQDLGNVIRALLQVAPHLRPSCDQILQLQSVVKRLNQIILNEPDEGTPFLLNTIKIPQNLHYLTDRLPKPNYSQLKIKKIEKQQFLQTLAGYKDSYGNLDEQDSYNDNGSRHSMLPQIGKKPTSQLPQVASRKDDNEDYQNEQFEIDTHNQSISKENPSQAARSHSRKSQVQPPLNVVNSNRNYSQAPSNRGSSGIDILVPISKNYQSSKQLEMMQKREIVETRQQNSDAQSIRNNSIHNQYEEKDQYRDLEKVYEVQVAKQKNIQITPSRKPPHHINIQREKHNISILDIEGESKPLLIKGNNGKRTLNNSILDDHYQRNTQEENNQLPALVGQHLQINSNIENSKLPPIQGSNILGQPKMSVKDLSKIKQISQAYQVGLSIEDSYQQSLKKKIQEKQVESTDFEDNKVNILSKKDSKSQQESAKVDELPSVLNED